MNLGEMGNTISSITKISLSVYSFFLSFLIFGCAGSLFTVRLSLVIADGLL